MSIKDTLNLSNNIYAKVTNGKVVEYPVSELHIHNRSQPKSMYTLCKKDTKPTITSQQYLTETLEVTPNLVLVHYNVVDKTLQQLLDGFKDPSSNTLINPTPLNISAISTADIAKVSELTNIHVQTLLDDFAVTKGYDNINSTISYLNSTVLAYSTEAATASALRDNVWSTLNTYLTDVTAGTLPLPLKVSDIEAVLPTFVW